MKKIPTKTLLLSAGLFAIAVLLNALFPLPKDKLFPTPSTQILDRNGELLRAFLAPDGMWRYRIGTQDIPENLKIAALTFEDRFFFLHPGINPASILRAAWTNLRAGKVVQGGSTITMQVARLMTPKSRTIGNKIIEALRALQVEWHYSKEEILTFYFNLAPYGGNLVGAGAAARFYFGKRLDQLSLGEAALLAAIPNSPNRYRPDRHPQQARDIRDRILARLQKHHRITHEEKLLAQSEPIPTKRFAQPFAAPHLTDYIFRRHSGDARIQTSVDMQMQNQARDILQAHLKSLRAQGIYNGAVVAVDNRSGELLTLVGSPDFHDVRHQGQVNGALARRSPGSALKPFVYALGLQYGLISPQSLLEDVPVEYAGYRPQNYDDTFHGAVTVEEALVRSLNVPAVNLYARLGDRGLYGFLKEAGITTLQHPKEYYGLSLVLGGGEVNLLELTNLYAGLARAGRFKPVTWLASTEPTASTQLLDPAVCFILTEMLSKLRRPELPAVWDATVDIPKVAWKTGTSYGHKDAWSIGYTPDLSIGVWVGNADGKGAPALVGADVAAPILFDLFDAFSSHLDGGWFRKPDAVQRRQVCAVSGMRPSELCATVKNEYYIPGISPNRVCTVHQTILVDDKTGTRLCGRCRIGRTYRKRIVEIWPPEIASWKNKHGLPLVQIPSHFPGCTQLTSGSGPVIQSPQDGAEYKIRAGVRLDFQRIRLSAATSNDTQTVYWFVDGQLFYTGSPEKKIFMEPNPGRHTLLCVDEQGRSDQIKITVR